MTAIGQLAPAHAATITASIRATSTYVFAARFSAGRVKKLVAGTTKGGKAAAATNYKKYGKDFYRKIGAKGGRNGRKGIEK